MLCPFVVLGLSSESTPEEIRDRYLSLVRKFPPAVDPDRFELVREAYEAVSIPRNRVEAELFAAARCESFEQAIEALERAATYRRPLPGLREILDAEGK